MPETTATAPRMPPKRVLDLTLDQQAWIETHKKSKGIAVLLALLLTGAANLYAGQISVGLVFLLVEFLIFVPLMFVGVGFLLHLILAVIALAIAVGGIDTHNASLYTDVLSKESEEKTGSSKASEWIVKIEAITSASELVQVRRDFNEQYSAFNTDDQDRVFAALRRKTLELSAKGKAALD